MLRRFAFIFALAMVVAPVAVRAHEWEEEYPDGRTDQGAPDDSGDADVDVDASVTFDSFHSTLAPYGEWVVVGNYGRVWRPHVAAGWRPYYYGRWEWTNEGWLWVSEEPWGWAAYHYGRWSTDPYYGWIWVPGYQWAPAWVSWRYSGDVVGWAPLGPGASVYVSVTNYYDRWWTFVPCHSFVAHPVYSVAYQPSFTQRYWRATAPAPAYRGRPGGGHAPSPAWGGPPPRTIEQRIGRPVTPVRVVGAPAPGAARVGNGEVAMYRPGLRTWDGPRRPSARPGLHDDGRSAPSEARRDSPFRSDEARHGSPFRDGDVRRDSVVRGGNQAGQPGAETKHGQARGWGSQDRGAQSAASTPNPSPRQEAPRSAPPGWKGPAAGSQNGGAPPRAMAPPRSGGDRGGGGHR